MISPSRSTWRLLLTPPMSGAENMALDEALMSRARATGEWVLRVYSWATPTVSFGRNQTAAGRYDVVRMRALGLDVVRRPTGGRAILHDREVTYSVTAPAGDAGELRESYTRINRLLVAALESLGVAASPAAVSSRARSPGTLPCFAEPSQGELTVDGRKLAGSAQWRNDGAMLQHGSILVENDQSVLASLVLDQAEVRELPTPATLEGILRQSPSVSTVGDALFTAVKATEDSTATALTLDHDLRARASALVVRYMDEAWTWRR